MRLTMSAMATVCCKTTPARLSPTFFLQKISICSLCVFFPHPPVSVVHLLFSLDSLLHAFTPLVSTKRGHSNVFRLFVSIISFDFRYPILLFIIIKRLCPYHWIFILTLKELVLIM